MPNGEIDLSSLNLQSPANGEIDLSSLGLSPSFAPGDSPERPINRQHPEIGLPERALLMNLSGGNPDVVTRHLQSQGFEAAHRGDFNFAIRRPGGKWHGLEKEGFEFSDLTDVLGGAATTTAGIVAGGAAAIPSGLALGTAGMALGPAGAAVGFGTGFTAGGSAGAAAGSGAVEAGLVGLGKAFGLDPTLGEAAGAVTREGFTQGVGQAVAPVVGAAIRPIARGVVKGIKGTGKLLQKPYQLEKRGEAKVGQILDKISGKAAQDEAEVASRAAAQKAKEGTRLQDIRALLAEREAKKAARETERAAQGMKKVRRAEESTHAGRAGVEAFEYGKEAARLRSEGKRLLSEAEAAGEKTLPDIPTPKGRGGKVAERVRIEAESRGVDPDDLAATAGNLWKTEQAASQEIDDAVKLARKKTGLTPSKIRLWEESGKDSSTWPGLDQVAQELAPQMGWGDEFDVAAGAQTKDYVGRLWELLKEPARRKGHKYDQDVLDRAARELGPPEPKAGGAPKALSEDEAEAIKQKAREFFKQSEAMREKATETRSRAGLYRQSIRERAAMEAKEGMAGKGSGRPNSAEMSPRHAEIPSEAGKPIPGPEKATQPVAKGRPAAEEEAHRIYSEAREKVHGIQGDAAFERHASAKAAAGKLINWDTRHKMAEETSEAAYKMSKSAWDDAHRKVVALGERAGLSRDEAVDFAARLVQKAQVKAAMEGGEAAPKALPDFTKTMLEQAMGPSTEEVASKAGEEAARQALGQVRSYLRIGPSTAYRLTGGAATRASALAGYALEHSPETIARLARKAPPTIKRLLQPALDAAERGNQPGFKRIMKRVAAIGAVRAWLEKQEPDSPDRKRLAQEG